MGEVRCRLCLNKGTMTDGAAARLRIITKDLFSFEIRESDTYASVCLLCLNKVTEFHEFYAQVMKNQSKLDSLAVLCEEEVTEDVDKVKFVQGIRFDESELLDCDLTFVNIDDEPKRQGAFRDSDEDGSGGDDDDDADSMETFDKEHLDAIARKFFKFGCDECEAKRDFDTFDETIAHFKEHHSEQRPFVKCCDVKIYDTDSLYIHLSRHLQPSEMWCRLCKKSFKNKGTLRYHMKMRHRNVKDDKTIKEDPLTKSGSLQTAVNETHVTQQRVQECGHCFETFDTLLELVAHVTSTHKTAQFICNVCNNKFDAKSVLIKHLENHRIEKIPCPMCDVVLKTERGLKNHMRLHKSSRLRCSKCEYSTPWPNNLRSHELVVHNNHKAYTCNVCDKQFKYKRTLENHKAEHTGLKRFECKDCSKRFPSYTGFYLHIKRVHKTHKVFLEEKRKLQK